MWLSLAILQQPQCVNPTAGGGGADSDPTLPFSPIGTRFRWGVGDSEGESPAEMCGLDTPIGAGEGGAAATAAAATGGGVFLDGVDPDEVQLMDLDARIMCNDVMPDGSPVGE